MKLLKNRNDRVMVGVGSVLAGLAVAVVFTSALFDPQFAELSSTSKLFGNSASAAEEPTYHAQPANGPVLPAHKISKIVKSDGPISIVRDPAWRPTLGPDSSTFRMSDLLLFAFEGKKALLAPLG